MHLYIVIIIINFTAIHVIVWWIQITLIAKGVPAKLIHMYLAIKLIINVCAGVDKHL